MEKAIALFLRCAFFHFIGFLLKKIINISGIDSLLFVGVQDCNIKALEDHFSAKIIVRGDQVNLDGKKEELIAIESIINDMILTITKKGFIEVQDVNLLIDIMRKGKIDIDDSQKMPIILHTHSGNVVAKTEGQKKYYNAVQGNDIVFAIGPAGTGKTYQAVASAVSALKRKEVAKIVITRPAVEAGESLGFLPGDLKDKVDPYLTPLYDALNEMIPREKLKFFLDRRIVEIAPLAYMRGRTLHNAFIILDEAQNATRMQMKMFLTRLGVTSKAIITGDVTQIDLPNSHISGLVDASNVLKKVKGIDFIFFDESDVVRHKLVKKIIKAYGKKNEDNID